MVMFKYVPEGSENILAEREKEAAIAATRAKTNNPRPTAENPTSSYLQLKPSLRACKVIVAVTD